MHREQLAAERLRDAMSAVEHHVEREVRCPSPAAIARTSSCTGLPCVTPQRASGWPMRAASCSTSVVSRPARPGRDELRPAREAREEVRLDEPRRDAHVGARPLAVQPHRDVGAEATHPRERRVVARIVVDDAHRREHLVAEHRAQLVVGVAAVRAGGDEHDDVFEAHEPVELLEDGRHDDLARLGPRAVADADRDRPPPRTTSRSGGPATGRRSASSTAARSSAAARRVAAARRRSCAPRAARP